MTHRHVYDAPKHSCVDLAPDVCARPTVHGGAAHITNPDGTMAGGPDEHLAGFLIAFDVGEEYRLEGAVNVDPHFADRPIWTMTGTLEGGDLTLRPSVLMTSPGQPDRERHGFVTNGKWEPA